VITTVIFDLGGVLVELGPVSEILGETSKQSEQQFWPAWLRSSVVREFETGRCSAAEFGERLVAETGADMTGAEFLERFRRWPKGLMTGASDLVVEVQARLRVGVLSNTNVLHWQYQQDSVEIQDLFERRYLSFEVGIAKPDRGIFRHVLRDLDQVASSVLFLDDNRINVDAAREIGMKADLVRGADAARAALVARGLL
jgi:glucose-1-phosphatase